MQLRDYQIDISKKAAAVLKEHHLVYLSMEVRTGKTLTALETARLIGASRVLFVTKKKAIQSIEDDFEKLAPGFFLIVTNFESLHHQPDTFDLVIIDEAHSIGAFPLPAERTKELKRICKGRKIIYLSGTPTPESWSQIYHQFYVSSYSPFAEWPSFYKWAKDFVQVKSKFFYNREVKDYSQADKEKIDQYCKHLFISYSQQDAGFESLVEEKILYVKMQPSTYKLIEKLKRDRVVIGKDGDVVEADTEVKLMQKMHQICSGSVITDKDVKSFDLTKAIFIKDEFRGKKIAIFYKYIGEKSMLQWVFAGRTTESPEQFNASEDLIFISQVQAGREGINLSTADCLVMYNIDFSAVSYWQARARLQTKNRTAAAFVYWIFSDGGIEDRIYKMVKDKKDFTLSYFKKEYGIKRISTASKDQEPDDQGRVVSKQAYTDIIKRLARPVVP